MHELVALCTWHLHDLVTLCIKDVCMIWTLHVYVMHVLGYLHCVCDVYIYICDNVFVSYVMYAWAIHYVYVLCLLNIMCICDVHMRLALHSFMLFLVVDIVLTFVIYRIDIILEYMDWTRSESSINNCDLKQRSKSSSYLCGWIIFVFGAWTMEPLDPKKGYVGRAFSNEP